MSVLPYMHRAILSQVFIFHFCGSACVQVSWEDGDGAVGAVWERTVEWKSRPHQELTGEPTLGAPGAVARRVRLRGRR